MTSGTRLLALGEMAAPAGESNCQTSTFGIIHMASVFPPGHVNGFRSNHVRLQLFRFIEVIVSLVTVLMTPPLVKFASVKAKIQHPRAGSRDVLADGVLKFRLVDKCGNGAYGSQVRQNVRP